MNQKNQPVVDMQERRQERVVSQVRIIQKVGVLVGQKWIWQEFELNPAQVAAAPSPPPQEKKSPPTNRQTQPMTHGRDPAKHLITFGKKFNGMTIEEADNELGKDELHDFAVWGRKQEEPSPSLEVACEMIEAYLIEREFVPTPKNKQSRWMR